ncbi:unnamed protein product [Cuscuta campestris]|uniref:Uncharacterized protein n=2 Tax=Cuscuta sect. Cleistogrammica TaxID=1824901 RepID=A0A484MU42_9ASTE|nr:hypothetical protein DM860_014241 [Cuscuta australis]VFQ92482.1 unnamed protein product [Cuscuta campestris]
MEDQCIPFALPFFFQEEGIEELKQSLFYTTMELENTIVCAHDEISKKDQEILHLKNLLAEIVKERDEFVEKLRILGLEKALLHQQVNRHFHKHLVGVADANSNSEDQRALSSSDSDDVVFQPPPPSVAADEVLPKMPMPENGKFLKAVVEAGPLLQTLLLAGPLPDWQRPPPQLDIPPVTMSPAVSTPPHRIHQESVLGAGEAKKRAANGARDTSSSPSKYQRVFPSTAIISTS